MAKPAAPASSQSLAVPITSANILALTSTPVLLVPAPGAGSYIDVLSWALEYQFGTVKYDGNNSVSMTYDMSSDAHGIVFGDNIFGEVADAIIFSAVTMGVHRLRSNVENKPVLLFARGNFGPWINGDGTGTATVRYQVRNFA